MEVILQTKPVLSLIFIRARFPKTSKLRIQDRRAITLVAMSRERSAACNVCCEIRQDERIDFDWGEVNDRDRYGSGKVLAKAFVAVHCRRVEGAPVR